MCPTLFELPLAGHVFALDSHGLCVTLGALLGLWLALRLGRELPVHRAALRDVGLELALVGVVGARLVFVLGYLPAYATACRDGLAGGSAIACTRPLWLWEGGMSFLGAAIASLAWLAWRGHRVGVSAWTLGDTFSPGIALAQVFGRIGCFLAGCDYGKPTSGFGLRFPGDSVAFEELFERGLVHPSAEATPPLVPVQLYDAVGHLALLAILLVMLRRQSRPGRVLGAYLLGQGLLRFALDPLRGDLSTAHVIVGCTSAQLSAAVFIIAGVVIMRRK